MRILSLGAGVQSSTIALMIEHGEIEGVDAAIFADTQAEPKAVMEWLDFIESKVSFPIYRVTKGDLRADSITVRTSSKSGNKYLSNKIPAYLLAPDGSKGLLGRRCTADYKVAVIERKVKELLGIKRWNNKAGVKVTQLIGISLDEAIREKPSKRSEVRNEYPLLDRKMTRHDCLNWMKIHGYPEPPKSACLFCPFHSDAMWLEIKKNKQEWLDVVMFERSLQAGAAMDDVTRGKPFLHRSCVPIDQVEFQPKTNFKMHQVDLFGNECSGLCGV